MILYSSCCLLDFLSFCDSDLGIALALLVVQALDSAKNSGELSKDEMKRFEKDVSIGFFSVFVIGCENL